MDFWIIAILKSKEGNFKSGTQLQDKNLKPNETLTKTEGIGQEQEQLRLKRSNLIRMELLSSGQNRATSQI